MLEDLLSIIERHGPLAVMFAYFVLKDWMQAKKEVKEKNAMGARITSLETYQINTVATMATKSTEVITEVTVVIGQAIEVIGQSTDQSKLTADVMNKTNYWLERNNGNQGS